jgi:hypothetical protein
MTSLIHAVKAEWIKGRHSFLRYSPIVFLFIILIFLSVVYLDAGSDPSRISNNFAVLSFVIWVYGVFPFYCIFISLLNFATEHSQRLWKHLNVQSVSGVMQALAKHINAWCYVATSTIILSLLIVIILVIFKLIYSNPNIVISDATFWIKLCQMNLVAITRGMVIVSILNVFAARFTGTLPLMFGIVGGIMGPMLIFIKETHPAALWFPWTIGMRWFFNLFSPLPDGPFKPWWTVIPLIWIAIALIAHVAMQLRRPLY